MSFVGLLAYSGVTIRVYFIARLMRAIWEPGANQPSSDHGGGSGEKMDISVFLPALTTPSQKEPNMAHFYLIAGLTPWIGRL